MGVVRGGIPRHDGNEGVTLGSLAGKASEPFHATGREEPNAGPRGLKDRTAAGKKKEGPLQSKVRRPIKIN